MHVCYVCREYPPSLRGGGISTYLKEMTLGLVSLGHKVTVICASDDTRKKSIDVDGRLTIIRLSGGDFFIPGIEKYNLLKKLRIFYRFKSYRKKVYNTIKSFNDIDIIEVAEFGAEGLYLDNLNIPLITRLHCPLLMDFKTTGILEFNKSTFKYYWQGIKELTCIRKSHFISSPSNIMAFWASKYANVPISNIKIIPNPIKCNNIDFNIKKPSYIKDNKNVVNILFVGTICEFKGCGELCKSVDLLYQEGIKIVLTMVGKHGEYTQKLKVKYDHAEWLKIEGFKTHEEIQEMYRHTDIVCIPSWWESFSLVCAEAMQNGAIVIGSKSGGMSEIINDGIDGFLINPQNYMALYEKIKMVINLPIDKKNKISIAAQNKIYNKFNLNIVLRKMINYYNDCINEYKVLFKNS